MSEYARPEMLVSTEWLAQHLHDPGLRIVEVDADTSAYEQGHIPGAVGWNWQTQLCDQLRARHSHKGDHRLLPHRRALQPYLVCAEIPAGLAQGGNYNRSWTAWGNLVGAPIERV